jgi:hypothetical protein
MSLFQLSDDFSFRGSWWLPENPDRKIRGEVFYLHENGTELKLEEMFSESNPNFWGNNHSRQRQSYTTILGQLDKGEKCTIFDAQEIGTHSYWPANRHECSFFFDKMTIGSLFFYPEQTSREVRVSFTKLIEWVEHRPFSIKNEEEKESFIFSKHDEISSSITSINTKISIRSELTYEQNMDQMNLRYKEHLWIEPTQPQKLEWYIAKIYMFRVLFSILSGDSVNLLEFMFFPEEKSTKGAYVNVYFRQYGEFTHKKNRHEITFPCKLIFQEIDSILNLFFEKFEKLEVPFSLFHQLKTDPALPIDFQFLSIIQCLESYQRIIFNEQHDFAEEACAKTNDIFLTLSSSEIDELKIDTNLRQPIKNRIKSGNKYSLREKLSLLFKNISPEMKKVIFGNDENFIERTVATRNYLTHRDDSKKQLVWDFKEKFNATFSLKFFIDFLLLKEIGIPEQTIQKVMETHSYYQNRPRFS